MGMIALDTETALVSEQQPVPPMTCAQLADGDDTMLLHAEDIRTPDWIAEALQDTIALANAPFDFAVICEEYPQLEKKVWKALREFRVIDVLTRERMIDLASTGLSKNAAKYSLKGVTKRWCGHDLDKKTKTRTSYGELRSTPLSWWSAEAIEYATEDARWTFAVAEAQELHAARFKTEHGLALFEDAGRQARAHWALHLGALHGMHTDQPRVLELESLLRTKMDGLAKRLTTAGLMDAKGVKKQKPLQAMLRELGVTTHTDGCKCQRCGGAAAEPRLAADAETLELLDLADDHALSDYREFARAQKLLSTYVLPFKGKSIVRPWYTELVSNGRTSSSGDLRQNMPQQWRIKKLLGIDWGVKECLVPAPGNVFVAADFSKAELVSWAQVLIEIFGWDAPTAALARALNAGVDVHDQLLKTMGGGERTMAKIGNFSFMGGGSPERLVSETLSKFGVRLELDAVRRMRQAWGDTWAGGWYFTWIQDQLVDGKMDFMHSSGRLVRNLGYTDACNYPFSGRTADATKDCLWRLAVEMYTEPDSPLFDARQPLFVHDENVLECKRENAEAVAQRLEEVMKATYLDWCPDVPVGVDVKILERYSK